MGVKTMGVERFDFPNHDIASFRVADLAAAQTLFKSCPDGHGVVYRKGRAETPHTRGTSTSGSQYIRLCVDKVIGQKVNYRIFFTGRFCLSCFGSL